MDVFVIRHGETEWSFSGQHTNTTDIPLTANGRRPGFNRYSPRSRSPRCSRVPPHRARETCELAGLGDQATIDPDLREWNYGEYEGLTSEKIHERAPDWLIFEDGRRVGKRPSKWGHGWIA